MKKMIATVAFSLLAFNSTASYAYGECLTLNVEIANDTAAACELTNVNRKYGSLSTAPAMSIPSGETAKFKIKQTFAPARGPDITVNYVCNGQAFSVRSQQNYCSTSAGNITGEIKFIDAGLFAQHTFDKGKHVALVSKKGKQGTSTWLIKD